MKVILRDDDLLTQVLERVNARLRAAQPELRKERRSIESQITKARRTVQKYFTAFENDAMSAAAEDCGEKVSELKVQIQQLESSQADIDRRLAQLEIPALDRPALTKLIDQFERVMEAGANAQRKALLQLLVPRVVINDRHSIEVDYRVPNVQRFAHPGGWQAHRDSFKTLCLEPTSELRLVFEQLRSLPVAG